MRQPTAPFLQALDIEYVDGCVEIGWADLIETLQTEEMSELEAVEGYLREVEDPTSATNGSRPRRNRHAHAMALRMGDRALAEADIQYAGGICSRPHAALSQSLPRGP